MKVIVFGATGSVGRLVVEQALAAGHRVTAFARNPQSLEIADTRLNVISGDVLDKAAVEAAIVGHDGVLVALGDGRRGKIRAAGTRNIVAAMKRQGIRRLVCMSSMGAGDSEKLLNWFWKHLMFGMLLKKAMADHNEQERILRENTADIDWVIARPAALTDDDPVEQFQHGTALDKNQLTLKIPRMDVANFMLAQLQSLGYRHQSPSLSV